MKSKKIYSIVVVLGLLVGCTSEFEEFKEDIDELTSEDVSAKFFFTNTQINLWMPVSWNYLFTRFTYGSAYGGYASFGFKDSWEQPDVVFNMNRSWGADGSTWNWFSRYNTTLDLFLSAVEPGSDLENPLMEAVGLIMKSSYFAMYTDLWGDLPYSEVGVEGILTPKYDSQMDIYKGVIAELDKAMATIGDHTVTGEGPQDLNTHDVVFGGNLQQWKAYANGLKLRIALRAKGAPGETFADAAITEALNGPLPTESIKIVKDIKADFGKIAATDGDFRQYAGSLRLLSRRFINALKDNDDPRLSAYAEPVPGGDIVMAGYTNATNKVLIDYLVQSLDEDNIPYTSEQVGEDLVLSIEKDKYYMGQELRFADGMKTFLHQELFSKHKEIIEGKLTLGEEIDQMIMPLSEVYFMQAEAAVLGFGGDANALYQAGIQASFDQWEVSDNGYLASPIATLSGTKEEQLQQIGFQAWLALYMVDYQGWTVARDFHLDGVTDDTPDMPEIFSTQINLGLKYPQRIKYGANAYALNGDNVAAANASQGADVNGTMLWFAKGSK